MKTYEELYKEWSGEDYFFNSCREVHDSAEMIAFAEYCVTQKKDENKLTEKTFINEIITKK